MADFERKPKTTERTQDSLIKLTKTKGRQVYPKEPSAPLQLLIDLAFNEICVNSVQVQVELLKHLVDDVLDIINPDLKGELNVASLAVTLGKVADFHRHETG
jgi:hypothetical protein